jgi:hypothetical protein
MLAQREMAMDEAAIRAAVTRFLRDVSATAQGEIERSLRSAIGSGQLKGHETLTVAVALSSDRAEMNVTIYNKIEL